MNLDTNTNDTGTEFSKGMLYKYVITEIENT